MDNLQEIEHRIAERQHMRELEDLILAAGDLVMEVRHLRFENARLLQQEKEAAERLHQDWKDRQQIMADTISVLMKNSNQEV